VAQGPITIANNIAGLNYLEGSQVSAGGGANIGGLDFTTDDQTNVSGGGSDGVVGVIPYGGFFASHRLNEQVAVGFGLYGDFGSALDYGSEWSGRYFADEAALIGISLVPGVAYRFNDQWSVGVGLRAMNGYMNTQLAIDNTPTNSADFNDGKAEYEDDAWGFGGNAGVIYQPQEGTRIGLSYTSKVDLGFEDKLKIKGVQISGTGAGGALSDTALTAAFNRLNNTSTSIDMSVPQTVTLSAFHQLSERWALLASTNWQDWSRFGELGVQLKLNQNGEISTTVDQDFDDTFHLSLGAQYQQTDSLRWDMGISYDTAALDDQNRSFLYPIGQQVGIGTGLKYDFDKSSYLHLTYQLSLLGDVSVQKQRDNPFPAGQDKVVSGEFENAHVHAIGASMNWMF
jgi:long-chain fatty acid transport protein